MCSVVLRTKFVNLYLLYLSHYATTMLTVINSTVGNNFLKAHLFSTRINQLNTQQVWRKIHVSIQTVANHVVSHDLLLDSSTPESVPARSVSIWYDLGSERGHLFISPPRLGWFLSCTFKKTTRKCALITKSHRQKY